MGSIFSGNLQYLMQYPIRGFLAAALLSCLFSCAAVCLYWRTNVTINCLQILEEIERHRIRIYEFPECDSDEDEESKQQDSELKVSSYVTLFADSNCFHALCRD